MTHARFETMLLLRASGELETAPAEELAEHLPACPACRAFAEGLDSVSRAAGLSLEDPSAALVRKTRGLILSGRENPRWKLPWNWIPAGLSLALATLLLMVGRQPRPESRAGSESSGAHAVLEQDDLSQVEADLDELEALASEPDWDLTEIVTGGDL